MIFNTHYSALPALSLLALSLNPLQGLDVCPHMLLFKPLIPFPVYSKSFISDQWVLEFFSCQAAWVSLARSNVFHLQ